MQRPNSPVESAILVGINTQRDTFGVDDSLNELSLLATTAGAEVKDRVVQSLAKVNPATFIGKGKVQELAERVKNDNIDLVIFDDDLSPNQIRNLERLLSCKLLDRSALILDIFAQHARTATAKVQVELAQLEYLRTRLTRQWTHLSRQKGGIGTKGPGETQIETDRRLIGNRIATLKKKLTRIDQQRRTQRKKRSEMPRISLVGYTNAGKSTLMNALSGADVLAEDKLFATLDATTRITRLDSTHNVLMSDTVGFIRKLPHGLVESFKSTLDEVRESDILLHVVDVSHPKHEEHIDVVQRTLMEIGASGKPTILVLNKIDLLHDTDRLRDLRLQYPEAVLVSGYKSIGMEALRDRITLTLSSRYIYKEIAVPVTAARLIAKLHSLADVVSELVIEPATDDGPPLLQLQLRIPPENVDKIAALI